MESTCGPCSVCLSSECCCSLLCSQADVSWTAHQGQVPDSGLEVPLQRENAGSDATGQFPHRPARAVLPAHLQQTHLSQSWRRYHMSSLSQLLSSAIDFKQVVPFLSHIANRHASLIFNVSLSPIRNALAQSLVLKRFVKMWSAVSVSLTALIQTHTGSLISVALTKHWGRAPVFLRRSHLHRQRSRKQAWRLMLPLQTWSGVFVSEL